METGSYWDRRGRGRLNRRRLLSALAAGSSAAYLAACSSSASNNNAGQATTAATSAPRASASAAAASTAPAVAAASGTPAAQAAAASTALPGAGSFKTGGTIQLAYIVVAPLDPYENGTYSTQQLAGFTYSRLFRFNSGPDPLITESAQPLPELVGGYEISPDHLTYTMKLRPGVQWQPPLNRPLSSDDVIASWQRFTTDTKNVNSKIYDPIVDSLTAPDDQTLVWKLKAPYVPFLNKLANAQLFWIMSREAVDGKIDPSQQMVGTGPWIFVGKSPTSFTFKKNPNYFIKGIPYADGVVLNIIPDTSTQEAQFQAGTLDSLGVPNADIDAMKRAVPKATIGSYLATSYYELFFTPMSVPNNPFSDPRMRQAASVAIDRKALMDLAFKGQGAWANSIPAGLGKWWLDPQSTEMGDTAKLFQFDPKMAKQLLDAAGHTNTELKFVYPNNAYGDTFNAASDALRGMLADAGFKVQSVTVDYLKDWINNGQGYFWKGVPPNSIGHVPQSPFTDPDDYLAGLFTPGGLRNDEDINDPDLLPIIKQQQQEFDEGKRLQLVYQAQKQAAAKMYYVPLISSKVNVFNQPWTQNYVPVNNYSYGTESISYMALNK